MVDARDDGSGAGSVRPAFVVGPALLFAALVGMLGVTGGLARQGLGGSFFPGMLAGALLAGVAACVASAVATRMTADGRPGAPRAAVVPALGVACASGACACCLAGMPQGPVGAAFGVGVLALALCWVRAFARLPFLTAFRSAAWSLAGGVLAYGLAAAVTDATGVAWLPVPLVGAEALASGALAALSLSGRVAAGTSDAPGVVAPDGPGADDPAAAGSPARGARAIVGAAWAPVVGLAICVFLLGLLWNQPAPAGGARALPLSLVSFAMPLASTVALGVAASRARGYAEVKRLVWTVMPVVAALFLITPNFDGVAVPAWNALVEGLQNAASCAQMLCAFALLLRASRAGGVSPVAAVGAAGALTALAGLAGLAVHGAVSQAGNVVAVVLFVVYVCATVAFLAVRGAGDREARVRESGVLESYLGPRCEALAARRGLTQRESEVLRLLARGHGYAFIAEALYISETTVRTHARNLYRKLGVDGQEGLINLVDAS